MNRFTNLDQALIGMSKNILEFGVWRQVRGFDCLEIPHPVMIEITNPTDRYITIPQRKWNKILPIAESLWMALGMNDLNSLPGRYVKSLYNFSDNGRTWRGGYGPRLRTFSGIGSDYDISNPAHRHIFSGHVKQVDQLRYVIKSLKRDINTRQAIIQFGDPVKDSFENSVDLKKTKDYPCSRTLQFMMVDGKLNCTLYIRSNDILFGLSAVNITNFTIMQEYVANIVGVPVGMYYHIANNLHVYKEHLEKIRLFASLDPFEYERGLRFEYMDSFRSLHRFDRLCNNLYNWEQGMWRGEYPLEPMTFGHDMIDDWALCFLKANDPTNTTRFTNPYLNNLWKVKESQEESSGN